MVSKKLFQFGFFGESIELIVRNFSVTTISSKGENKRMRINRFEKVDF